MEKTTIEGMEGALGPVEDPDKDEEEEALMRAHALRPVVLEARLLHRPRSLHDLWKEFEFGYSRCKPAKEWTTVEHGRDRFNYYRRNAFWMKESELLRKGYTADRACELFYSVYGQNSNVTAIIKRLVADKKFGGHPGLRSLVH